LSELRRSTEIAMPDFDPRDVDSRERDDGIHDREDQRLTRGRGGGSSVHAADDDVRERDDDWCEARDRESRERSDDRGGDPRDVFLRDLDLPRGRERELVHDRDRHYTLSGSESRTLATVGAFVKFGHHAARSNGKMWT